MHPPQLESSCQKAHHISKSVLSHPKLKMKPQHPVYKFKHLYQLRCLSLSIKWSTFRPVSRMQASVSRQIYDLLSGLSLLRFRSEQSSHTTGSTLTSITSFIPEHFPESILKLTTSSTFFVFLPLPVLKAIPSSLQVETNPLTHARMVQINSPKTQSVQHGRCIWMSSPVRVSCARCRFGSKIPAEQQGCQEYTIGSGFMLLKGTVSAPHWAFWTNASGEFLGMSSSKVNWTRHDR